MNSVYTPLTHGVRRFNRFYTNILGLLDRHLLDSEFSLSEARILYEIAHSKTCTARQLVDDLHLDPGYLSRIVKRFEKLGLIYRCQSSEDGRVYYLYLTDRGKETFSKLDGLSNRQIAQMLEPLPEPAQKKLLASMETIETTLSGQSASLTEKVTIRSELRPGDAGYLIYLHGVIYAKECGYNHGFEQYVCKTFYDFFENYRPEKDRLWFAEAAGEMIGAIAIVGHSATKAQLRWFILHPDYRGLGLGGKLLHEAMQYCNAKGYRDVFLETTADQKTAIAMYLKAGFQKVAEHPSKAWGKEVLEQTYVLNRPC